MSSLKSIISSFHLQDNLNPKVWYLPNEKYMGDPDGQGFVMRPKVRLRLLEIANIFIEFIGVDIVVSDVVMTGSLANYNWSKYSDADVHILVDLSQFDKDEVPLYQELFKIKKTLFNNTHNIKVRGYDVEMYIEDSSVPRYSEGTYSIMFDEWVSIPKKDSINIDKDLLRKKAQSWMDQIDMVISQTEKQDIEGARKLLKVLDEKLKKYRTEGLRKGGEQSYENLVFKILRRNGYLGKMKDYETEFIDKKLSVEQTEE